jgi:Na+-driven multidrug efflux pump
LHYFFHLDPECSTSSTNIDRVVKFGHEKSYIPSASSAIVIGGVLGVLQTLFIIFTAKPVLNYMGIHSVSPLLNYKLFIIYIQKNSSCFECHILFWMQNSPMLKPAQQYLILRSFGAPAVILSMAIQGIFRGIKDTRTPLYATSTSFLSLH